jgi:hypothetical protein
MKDFRVQTWSNTPQMETIEVEKIDESTEPYDLGFDDEEENEPSVILEEIEVEVSPITFNDEEEFDDIDSAIAYYDTLDLSNGGAHILYKAESGAYKSFRHSHIWKGKVNEQNLYNEIKG